jgi:hypothetical protein
MYNQTDDTKGIKTVGAVIIVAFFILAIMNVYEVM